MTCLTSAEAIAPHLHRVRGRNVILGRDLAALYSVSPGELIALLQKRSERWPGEFLFLLTHEELLQLTLNEVFIEPMFGPADVHWAFTEYGVLVSACVLNSTHSLDMGVHLMRAFLNLRTTSRHF